MRILLIASHLSTGGMPQVALKRVESLLNKHDVYVIEYRQIAWSFVVQREKIIKLLGDKFISLGNIWDNDESKRDKFIEIVEKINPDIIHLEEIPEMFLYGGLRQEHIDYLYRKDRKYKLIETTHTSTFDVNQKKYFPDKFLLVSKYSEQQYKKFNVPISVVEYPDEKLEKNKSICMNKLGLDPNYFHVLNVGLFNSLKNQGYVFDIAKKLLDYKIQFHFIGNLADNFIDYWKPLIQNKPDNCIVHDERNDVELFYQSCDLLIHSSLLELNPLAVKEAISYDMPILLNKLDTYLDNYDKYKNIKYLTMKVDEDSKYILNNFNIKKLNDNITFKQLLLDEYEHLNLEKKIKNEEIVEEIVIQDDDYIEYLINFVDGARVEINGKTQLKFGVYIFDNKTNELIYNTLLGVNNWCATNNKCYKEYKVFIKLQDKILVTQEFDLTNKNVLIQLDSRSIGDTLAWFPYVEEFRKKHNCVVYCSTFWNNWFIEQYPSIKFIEPGTLIKDIYAKYNIGWYLPADSNRNPIDYKKIPLQKTASDILGLEYKEIRPKINIPNESRPIEEKYVCIAQYSTANAKHWHYPCKDSNIGWQILVDWLNEQGYKVMVISKQKTKLKNIIDHTGNFPIEQRINELNHCEFFIGVGSGLSWLAWAVGKKVVMISGFSNPICEFQSNIINVHNFNVCNGCFNKHIFDRGDWNWCPEHKNTDRQFECSINITPKMITERIVSSKLIEKNINFDFDKYTKNIILNKDDVKISFEKENNKVLIVYSGEKTQQLNIDIKDFNTNKLYHTISDIYLNKNCVIWAIPNDKITNDIIVSFYQKNKILDLDLKIL
jgi:autotransporter strand-loop-strand O-heptosyltransferase